MDHYVVLSLIFCLISGSVIGSFLNVVILRLPQEDASIVFPGSHCFSCNAPIHWYDNLPIISYCLLRGKCRACGAKISMQYPLVELCTGLLAAAVYLRFGFCFDYALYFLFLAALVVIIFIDLHHQIIPDVISLPGIVVGFLGSFFSGLVPWYDSLIGILAGGGFLYAVAFLYYLITRRDGMGGGDIKLLAMIGAFLGWQSLLYVIFFSSFTGSIFGIGTMMVGQKGSQTRIAFGPFLALAAISYLFFQENITQIWYWYLNGVPV